MLESTKSFNIVITEYLSFSPDSLYYDEEPIDKVE